MNKGKQLQVMRWAGSFLMLPFCVGQQSETYKTQWEKSANAGE